MESKEGKMKFLEEDNLVLTSQVKAYSRQCEELKRTMIQLQEKSELLEQQLSKKEKEVIYKISYWDWLIGSYWLDWQYPP